MQFSLKANIADVFSNLIFYGELIVNNGKIQSINKIASEKTNENYIWPGFIDSHVHIESSMLVPGEFAKLAVVHGTVATVSDPHEIANVCGMAGVEFMITNGKTVPFKFNFGAPSCVPATIFETAGAALSPEDVDALLQKEEIKYLSAEAAAASACGGILFYALQVHHAHQTRHTAVQAAKILMRARSPCWVWTRICPP